MKEFLAEFSNTAYEFRLLDQWKEFPSVSILEVAPSLLAALLFLKRARIYPQTWLLTLSDYEVEECTTSNLSVEI